MHLKDKFCLPFYYLWSSFLKGFLTLLPIILTAVFLNFSFKVVKNWLRPIYDLEPSLLKGIPFSEFLLTFFFICLVGIIFDIFFLARIWHFFENLITKIPLVRPIYNGVKQLVQAFNPQDSNSFKQVVIVEFPTKNIYSVGFLTSEVYFIKSDSSQELVNIFIPLTPNPTAGFYIMVPKEQVTITDLTRQEAISLILSSGIIQPARHKT